MNIHPNLITSINDLRTGPLLNPVFDTSGEGVEPWQFEYSAAGIVGISLWDNEHSGCHLQRTEAQLRRFGADLRQAISCLPILNLLGSSDFGEKEYTFTRLGHEDYLPGVEAFDYYRVTPSPGAIELIIGDDREWRFRLVMAEDLARFFAEESDKALATSESHEMRALLSHLGL